MILYRGQPTAEVRAQAAERMSSWLRAALEHPDRRGMMAAQGRWFTDDPEIARWYADDAIDASEIVCVEMEDDEAERHRLSNLDGPLPCGLDPLAFSRDPEREFMIPRDIALRATVVREANI